MLPLNIFIPGSGLILRGRFLSGSLCLVLSMLLLGALILTPLIMNDELGSSLLWQLGLAYLLLSVASSIAVYLISRKPEWDQQQLRVLHQQASKAYLSDDHPTAVRSAQEICKSAATVIGSWQLLAVVAEAAGQMKLVQQAKHKIKSLQDDDL